MTNFKMFAGLIKVFLCATTFLYSMNGYALTICNGTCLPIPPVLPPLSIGNPPLLNPEWFLQLAPTQDASGWQYNLAFGGAATSLTMPFFSDANISSIVTPVDWSFSTGSTDIFGLGNGVGYMTWSYTGTGQGTGMFSFRALSGPTYVPYKFLFSDGTTSNYSGFIPLSSLAISAGLQPFSLTTPVPEVDSYAMLIIGFGLMCFIVRCRKKQSILINTISSVRQFSQNEYITA